MKDYGSQCPVQKIRNRVLLIALSSSAISIIVFFAIIATALTLLPRAIDAELDRRIAVVSEMMEARR